MRLAARTFALRCLSQRVGTCADGQGVRPLAEASLPLPPEWRDSDGDARDTALPLGLRAWQDVANPIAVGATLRPASREALPPAPPISGLRTEAMDAGATTPR